MPDVKFSNQYPYTDFHELNLDWVIKEVKFWSERVGKSIQKIELTGTVGLVDTYTINYSDGSTSTFDVTNGAGIASITKTGTVGLVDTYTITLQDGSTSTFEVHNGTASIDPTLTLSDYAADAKATGDAITTLTETTDRFLTAIFDMKKLPGVKGFINGGGTVTANNAYWTTEYFPIKTGDVFDYYISHGTTLPIIAFYNTSKTYDAAKSVIGISGYIGGTYTATADGYVRFTYLLSKPDVYVHFSDDININLSTELKSLYKKVYSIKTDTLINGFITAGGAFVSNNAYSSTGLIEIKSGDIVKYTLSHGTTLPIISFYNAAQIFDAGNSVNGVDGYSSGSFTAPADGFVRFTFLKSRSDVSIIFYSDIPQNVIQYIKDNLSINGVPGMNIVLMGDSIYGNDGEIADYLKQISGATVTNAAFGGTRVSARGGSDNFKYFDGETLVPAAMTGSFSAQDAAAAALSGSYPWIVDRLNTLKSIDFSSVDLLIMDYGTNDYTAGATIAQINTAYQVVIDSIRTHYPLLNILIATPIWRYFGAKSDNENGDNKVFNVSTLKEIAAAIAQFAGDKRVHLLDMYKEMPLDYNTADAMFDSGDSTHLNSSGNLIYAHILNGKIQSIY